MSRCIVTKPVARRLRVPPRGSRSRTDIPGRTPGGGEEQDREELSIRQPRLDLSDKGGNAFLALPCAGESDAEIVAGAWDFERINRRYARHLKILGERPGSALPNDAAAKVLLRWAAAEREAWLEAVTNDPLLPGRILPSDYLGQQALVAAC